MASGGKQPLTRDEFENWAHEIKASFTGVEERLDEHTRRLAAIEEKLKLLDLLDPILTELKAIRQNTGAMLKLYQRLDHRTEEIATHVHLDLRKVDAAFHPPA
jgi:hypothetical protein